MLDFSRSEFRMPQRPRCVVVCVANERCCDRECFVLITCCVVSDDMNMFQCEEEFLHPLDQCFEDGHFRNTILLSIISDDVIDEYSTQPSTSTVRRIFLCPAIFSAPVGEQYDRTRPTQAFLPKNSVVFSGEHIGSNFTL